MSIDMGGYDARRTVLSSKEAQEAVFAKHKERISQMRVVLTPTISVNIGTPRNIMSDIKLIKVNTDTEVQAGDVVRYNGKPCYVEGFDMRFVKIVTMDERKYSFSVHPQYIGCVIQRGGAA